MLDYFIKKTEKGVLVSREHLDFLIQMAEKELDYMFWNLDGDNRKKRAEKCNKATKLIKEIKEAYRK
jgi:hypothetical protein